MAQAAFQRRARPARASRRGGLDSTLEVGEAGTWKCLPSAADVSGLSPNEQARIVADQLVGSELIADARFRDCHGIEIETMEVDLSKLGKPSLQLSSGANQGVEELRPPPLWRLAAERPWPRWEREVEPGGVLWVFPNRL